METTRSEKSNCMIVERQSSAVGVTSQVEREPDFQPAKTRGPFCAQAALAAQTASLTKSSANQTFNQLRLAVHSARSSRSRCTNGRGLSFYFLHRLDNGSAVGVTNQFEREPDFQPAKTRGPFCAQAARAAQTAEDCRSTFSIRLIAVVEREPDFQPARIAAHSALKPLALHKRQRTAVLLSRSA